MKSMFLKIPVTLLGVFLLLPLGGCGKDFEWFPDDEEETTGSNPDENIEITDTDAGKFVSSAPATIDEKEVYLVATTMGDFYASADLAVNPGTAITFTTVFDNKSQTMKVQYLKAGEVTVGVYKVNHLPGSFEGNAAAGEILYDDNCLECHAFGEYDPVEGTEPDLSGKGETAKTLLEEGHKNIYLTAQEIADLRAFIAGN